MMDEPFDDRSIAKRVKRRRSTLGRQLDEEQAAEGGSNDNNNKNVNPQTPAKTRAKRVRFSDVGAATVPLVSSPITASLTPTTRNASSGRSYASGRRKSTSKTSRRRASMPATMTPRPASPPMPPSGQVQFAPLRQILDNRTKRRLRRNELSTEMNKIQREKYERRKDLHRQIEEKNKKLEQLELELEIDRQMRFDMSLSLESEEHRNVIALRKEVEELREKLRSRSPSVEPDAQNVIPEELDVIPESEPMDGDPMVSSPSHLFEEQNVETSIFEDVEVQASLPDPKMDAEIAALKREVENARNENAQVLSKWQSLFSNGQLPDSEEQKSVDALVEESQMVLATGRKRAEDAESAFASLKAEIKSLGFSHLREEDIPQELDQQFRSARTELERILPPGEMLDGVENETLLPALIAHIDKLYDQIKASKVDAEQLRTRESNLSDQFHDTLSRLEQNTLKADELGQQLSAKEAMLTESNEKVTQLGQELEEKEGVMLNLRGSLGKCQKQIASLELFVRKLQEDFATEQTEATKTLANLQSQYETELAKKQQTIDTLQYNLTATRTQQAQDAELISQNKALILAQNDKIYALTAELVSLKARVREEASNGAAVVKKMHAEMMQGLTRVAELKNSYLKHAEEPLTSLDEDEEEGNGEQDEEVVEREEDGSVGGKAPLTPVSLAQTVDT